VSAVRRAIRMIVNGRPRRVSVPPMKRLLDVLRQDCGLTGTKEGCGEGECGACSVLLDGRLVCSCLVLGVEAQGKSVETIEGIRAIKRELPGVLTSLGVSNVSFGLGKEARAVLNSAFLYHCVQAGLDMAIVNPADITPYPEIAATDRQLAEDLKDDGRLAERVVVKVRFKPFFTSTHGVPLLEPTLETDALEVGALAALAKFDLDRPVRLLGVRVELASPS